MPKPKKNLGYAVINIRPGIVHGGGSSSSEKSLKLHSSTTSLPYTQSGWYRGLESKPANTPKTPHSAHPGRCDAAHTPPSVPLPLLPADSPQQQHPSNSEGSRSPSISSMSTGMEGANRVVSAKIKKLGGMPFMSKKNASARSTSANHIDDGKRVGRDRGKSHAAQDSLDQPPVGTKGTMLTLSVYYASQGLWKNISFPPNVSISQAQDLCMLRFNVWQHVIEREVARSNKSVSSLSTSILSDSQQQQDLDDDTSLLSLNNRGSIYTEKTSMTNTNRSIQEHFGLYWPAQSKWLDSCMQLSYYKLKKGDIIELQEKDEFIYSNNRVTNIDQEVSQVYAEGSVYYLEIKGITTAWKLRWLVLSNQILSCYKKKEDLEPTSLLDIDLEKEFKLIDQNGQVDYEALAGDTTADDSGSYADGADSQKSIGLAALMGLASQNQLDGDGGPLIIKSGDQVHVFCTQNAADYDYWRRMLKLAQGIPVGEPGAPSSGSMVEQNEKPLSSSTSRSTAVASSGPQSPSEKLTHRPMSPVKNSSSPASMNTSLVHRRHDVSKKPSFVWRPINPSKRFVSTVYRKKHNLSILELCHCVIVQGGLYGFSDLSICSEVDNENLAAFADFMVGLRSGSVTVSNEVINSKHVIRLLSADPKLYREVQPKTHSSQSQESARASSSENNTATISVFELLWLEVGSKDASDKWMDALSNIGGIQQQQQQQQEQEQQQQQDSKDAQGQDSTSASIDHHLREMTLRRSKSVASTISRAEWPMPPTTIPTTSQNMPSPVPPVPPLPAVATIAAKAQNGRHKTQAPSSPGSLFRNPSLDAVGCGPNVPGSSPDHRASPTHSTFASRFQWFKRRGSSSK
ncbi:hypothetical protein GGI12_000952 [Dipsacomyces acuminosporus]|nr:hypothetical protein GGI12_000952 [Dipsacomyces acuminosporus]